MTTDNYNPKIDAYIEKAPPFAQVIMAHLREVVHKACPDIEETVKWRMPFFEHRGEILCCMGAFKKHCRFVFWGKEIRVVLREAKVAGMNKSGWFDRITRVDDLPADKQLIGFVRQAAVLIESGNQTSPMAGRNKKAKAAKSSVKMTTEFAEALKKNKKAATAFAAFSPSAKREYMEWIAEAKRPETRETRIATAIEWISRGKRRNWKYENC
ncbi:MAG TPA: YdeI/OmpD-associated family protein [Candidatus Acidoferrales bacterium]|nr:YdeI/OmpD-associated family protein [Candidatus Acidoferrales bacterium]